MKAPLILSFAVAAAATLSVADAFAPRGLARTAPPQKATATATALNADFFGGIGDALQNEVGSLLQPKTTKGGPPKREPDIPDVIIDADYRLAVIFLVLGGALDLIPYIQLTLGPLVTALGLLFLVQTARIRFCFDATAFELRDAGKDSKGNLKRTGDNIVSGGENRWSYGSFVNYDFFPEGWIDQPQGPILAYFKETETDKEMWDQGPGKSANSPEAIANGAVPGQIHFFPALCNCQQLRSEFEKRGCAKL